MTKPQTNVERQTAYAKRMREKGFIRLVVWGRKEDGEKIRDFAKGLRDEPRND